MATDSFELILRVRDELSDTLDAIRQRLEGLEQAAEQVGTRLNEGLSPGGAGNALSGSGNPALESAVQTGAAYEAQTEALARVLGLLHEQAGVQGQLRSGLQEQAALGTASVGEQEQALALQQRAVGLAAEMASAQHEQAAAATQAASAAAEQAAPQEQSATAAHNAATAADALSTGLNDAATASTELSAGQERSAAALAEAADYAGQTAAALAGLPAEHQLSIVANLEEVLGAIAQLQQPTSSTHTIHVQRVETPSGFAEGGAVFQRLTSPYIERGSGREDDVPALLMRNEFVLRAEAVKKYGLPLLYALNTMQLPQNAAPFLTMGPDRGEGGESALVRHYARGGRVIPVSRAQPQTNAAASTPEAPPLSGPDPDALLRAQTAILTPEQVSESIQEAVARANASLGVDRLLAAPQESLDAILSGFGVGVRALASGGAVGQADESLRNRKEAIRKDYDARIALARAQGNETIADLWVEQLETLEALIESLRQALAELAETYRAAVEDAQREHRQKVEALRAEYGGQVAQARSAAAESRSRSLRAKKVFGGSANAEKAGAVRANARALAVEEAYAREERAITADSADTLRKGLRVFQLGAGKEERQAVLGGQKTEREAGHAIRMAWFEALREIRELEADYARELAEAENTLGRTQLAGYTHLLASGGPVAARFAAGGAVAGGVEGQDSVPALLMPGEYVLNVAAARALGTQYLNAVNAGFHGAFAPLQRFAAGGPVGAPTGAAPPAQVHRVDITLGNRTASLAGTPDNVRTLVTALRQMQRTLA